MQSLYTASTGMLAMQTQIDTTANNIANVNTIGFKKSRAEFADLMYHVMEYAGTSTSDTTKSPTGIKYTKSFKKLTKVEFTCPN